jgi:hypothetical protein
MIQRGCLKGEKETTRVVSFIGDKADDITLFVAKVYSLDKKVLVVDLSKDRKILVNVAGDIIHSTVILRKICYTVDEEIYFKNGHEYDVVLLYSDCSQEMRCLMENSEYLYLCFGMQRFSLILLEKMFYITNLGIPYALVYRGVEDEKRKCMVEDIYHMLSAKKAKAERVYYTPICEKDIYGLFQLEYDAMVLPDLSIAMRELIVEATSRAENKMLKAISSKV